MKSFVATVIAVIIIFTVVLPINTFASENSDWTLREISIDCDGQIVSDAIHIHDMVYEDGKFVLIGGHDKGIAYTSEDGVNWKVNYIGQSGENLSRIIYEDDKFIAISDSKHISLSEDGENWTNVEIDLDSKCYNLYDIAYDGDEYIAVGSKGYMMSSEDGYDWSEVDSDVDNDLYGITYGKNRYIAVGEDGVMITSSNGKNWEEIELDTNLCLNAITYSRNRFVTKGSSGIVLISKDAEDWNTYEFKDIEDDEDNGSGKIIYENGKFIIDDKYVSKKAEEWDEIPVGGNAMAYGHNMFLIVDDSGTIHESRDTEKWTEKWRIIGEEDLYIKSILYEDESFIGVTKYGILSSKNGNAWSLNRYGSKGGPFQKIVYYNDKFIALSSGKTILLSEDGESWEEVNIDGSNLNDITHDRNNFIIVGDNGQILVSEDGYRWREASIKSSADLKAVVRSGGKRTVAISDSGRIYFSKDSHNWEEDPTNLDELIDELEKSDIDISAYHGNKKYLSVCGGILFAAEYVDEWEKITIDSTYDDNELKIFDIEFVDDKFIAFVKHNKNESSVESILMYESTNGTDWTKIGNFDSDIDKHDDFYSAAYGNDKYIVGGSKGKIFSINAEDLTPDPNVKKFETSYDVDPNKDWKIIFNNLVDEDSIDNIKVLDSSGSNIGDIEMSLYDNKTVIINAPSDGYSQGKKYTLVVENIKDKFDKSLKYKYIKDFVIEDDK